jgi:folylpolyglutamate synthase/dihydropteroate synthase
MAKYYLDGTGILSGELDYDAIEKRQAAERALQQAAAEREADQEATQHAIEAVMVDYLRDQISEELAEQKPSATDKRARADFLRFKAYCAWLDVPHLPASPPSVAAFLTSEIRHGRPHMRRCIKAISSTHHKADLPDPTSDLLVRALLRLAIEQPTDKPSQQKD